MSGDLLPRITPRPTTVGLVAGGLGAYWPQFPDLLPQLQSSARRVSQRVQGLGCDVVDAGFISDAEQGARAAEVLRAAGCDLIVGFLTTYMTASMLVPIAQRSGAPVLLINLQPTEKMDHATFGTGEWLAYCGACPLPEMASSFARVGVPFRSVSGYLEDERAWARIGRWISAAGVRGALRAGRHGLMGHLYPGMLDVSTDLTLVSANFGGHVEVLEFDDLRVRAAAVTDGQVDERMDLARTVFELDPSVQEEDFRWAARVSVGLDRLVDDFGLDSLAYYHRGLEGEQHERLGAGMILGASLLTARGVPACGEYELRTSLAMLITDRLGGGGSFTETAGAQLRRQRGRDGPRRPGSPADLRPPPAPARAGGLPRQARLGCVGRARCPAGTGDRVRPRSGAGRLVPFHHLARHGRARVPATDREHHLPRRFRVRSRRVDRRLECLRHVSPLGARDGRSQRRAASDR